MLKKNQCRVLCEVHRRSTHSSKVIHDGAIYVQVIHAKITPRIVYICFGVTCVIQIKPFLEKKGSANFSKLLPKSLLHAILIMAS